MQMIKITDKTQCCGCGACSGICPTGCIEMRRDEKGFFYPAVNGDKCLDCGKCEKVCPVPVWRQRENTPARLVTYAAAAKNEEIKMNSSSGGIFSLLAESVVQDGGVVFGAVFESPDSVIHAAAASEEEIAPMRGAKYIESDLKNTFSEIKELLKNGRKVLFSGTPCQTAGLKSFLGKDCDSLFCVSFICNSVASSFVFRDYLKETEKRAGKRAVKVNFRDKTTGWLNYASSFSVEFGDGSIHREQGSADLFKSALVNRIITRPICSDCPFRKYERAADITLGDFWGIEKTYPELSDNNGVSLAVVHTEKGSELLSRIGEKAELHEVDITKAVEYNPAFYIQTPPHRSRNMFWANYGKMSVCENLSACFDSGIKNRLKRFVYSRKDGI